MRRSRRSALVIATLILATMRPAAAQQAAGRLVASVVEAGTGAPIEGAEILIPALRRSGWADANGDATLTSLPAGDYVVRVRHLGHVQAELTVRIGEKPVGTLVILERRVVGLDTVRITGRYVPVDAPLAFQQRQALGIGRFLTDRDLRREGDRDFATVMSTRFAGVRAGGPEHARCLFRQLYKPLRRSRSATAADATQQSCLMSDCPIRVYLDEIEVTDDLWLVKTWDLAAVEYYTEISAPVQYRSGKTMCGLLLLWSKRS